MSILVISQYIKYICTHCHRGAHPNINITGQLGEIIILALSGPTDRGRQCTVGKIREGGGPIKLALKLIRWEKDSLSYLSLILVITSYL